jgi:hypothetical protein
VLDDRDGGLSLGQIDDQRLVHVPLGVEAPAVLGRVDDGTALPAASKPRRFGDGLEHRWGQGDHLLGMCRRPYPRYVRFDACMVYGRIVRAYDPYVGSYFGAAVLFDEEHTKLADVQVSLATADAAGERWFGSVQGLEGHGELNGTEVVIELPAGLTGKAKVVIDLTGEEPLIRLIGSGPAPV